MTLQRREFLARIAAGGVAVSMPAFLGACGVMPAAEPAAPLPENPFLAWFGIDSATLRQVMAALSANGADSAELYFQHRRHNELVLEGGAVGEARSEILQGVGLRVVAGERSGYAFTEDLTLPAMLTAARSASAMITGTRHAPPQHYNAKKTGNLYVVAVPWSDVDTERKLPILQRVERVARQADASIDKVSVHWSDSDERVLIATLDGHLIVDRRPMTRLSAQVTATRGASTQSGFASISARDDVSWYTDERIDAMTRQAVERTLLLFDARRAPSGELPVILAAGSSGIVLHEAIGHSLEADFNLSDSSVYANAMGESVAPSTVTLVDQGTIANQRGALNYDDEGNACGRNVLVENGVLRSYLHDSLTAQRYGVAVTGSARRESYRYAPMPRMTCTFLEAGPHSRDEIIAGVERGIIAESYTGGRVRLGAGDYSFDVKNGWLVEGGRISAPLRDFQIHGNGPETLQRIAMVGDDAGFDPGGWTCGKKAQQVPVSQGMPTVLVGTLAVDGNGMG